MNTKPILIIAGEPTVYFLKYYIKAIKKYNPKRPLIIIGSLNLIKKQIEFLKYKISFNLIDKNFRIKDLKKRN